MDGVLAVSAAAPAADAVATPPYALGSSYQGELSSVLRKISDDHGAAD
jgi:hypothetical protein